MAKITASQKKALEAAGYTVSGNSVKNKSGGNVGGYNENGQIWSGSSKVRDILKGGGAPAASSKSAPKAQPKAQAKAPVKTQAKSPVKAGVKTSGITASPLPPNKRQAYADNFNAMKKEADASGVGRQDAVRKNIKRKNEPVASKIYDKVYGAGKWKGKS